MFSLVRNAFWFRISDRQGADLGVYSQFCLANQILEIQERRSRVDAL
jgi:hypothetical protein